jgi:RNA 2',3'-cyclic 3'-phosphodiesterase
LSRRIFAALELPPELQRQLAQLQKDLKAAAPPRCVRWVRPEGIHLTLKFYGEVAEERLPDIQAGLARAAGATSPMALTGEGVGVFPNAARPTVVWAGVSGALAPLQQLQAAVEDEAVRLGFKPEGHAYQPHLTLGRVNDGVGPADIRRLMDALGPARARHFGEFTPGSLSLMKSELGAGGSVYSRLSAVALGPLERSLRG